MTDHQVKQLQMDQHFFPKIFHQPGKPKTNQRLHAKEKECGTITIITTTILEKYARKFTINHPIEHLEDK